MAGLAGTGGGGSGAAEAPPYRWVILLACTLLIGIVSVAWHSFSVFLVALTEHFGWSRAQTSLGFSIFVVVTGFSGPASGQLIARFGARPVVAGGGVLLALGLAATSRMTELWQFYLFFGGFTAVGFSAAGWVPTVTLLQSWFQQRLGTATGVASAGVGMGIFVLVPAIQASITSNGWQTTYLVMAGTVLVVVVLVSLVLREGPLARPRRSSAAGDPPDDPRIVDPAWVRRPWSLGLALHTGRYWYLLAAFGLSSFASQQVLAHHVAYLRAEGFPALAAATIVGVVGIASIPAKIGWGVAADRIGRELTYSFGLALVIMAIITLWLVPVFDWSATPYIYAILIGGGYAVSAVIPPLVTADLYRGAAYSAIFGGIQLASNLGTGTGTWLAGAIFDASGSYRFAFVLAIAGAMVSGICMWLAAPRKVRRITGRGLPAATPVTPRKARSARSR